MDWTLERVNGPRNFIVLQKGERSYPCGRHQTNKIVCPSLVVSRRHCIFVRADDVISVIDLGSSNGIYVNGELIEPNVLVELQENDVIGIGSYDEYRDNEPMFIFKLHKGNLNSRNLEAFDDLLTQRSSASSISVQAPNSPETSAPISNEKPLKRNLPNQIKDEEPPVVPQKVFKLSNELHKIPNEKVEPSGFAKRLPEAHQAPEVEEIEEIWSTLSPPKTSKPKSNGMEQAAGVCEAVERKGLSLNRSDRLTFDIKNEKEEKKSWKKVELVNDNTELRTSGSLDSANEKESQTNSRGVTLPKEAKTVATTELIAEKTTALISSPENTHKTIRFSLDASSSTTRLTVDILDANESLGCQENEIICRRSNSEDSLNRKKKDKDKMTHIEGGKKCNEVTNRRDEPTKYSANFPNAEPKRTANNFESSRFSFTSKDPVATSSPLKLKLVKQEPMTSFSIFDTVDLSDDDQDIFPSSQLFDSTGDGSSLKVENRLLSTKAENVFENGEEEDDDKNFFTEIDAVIQEPEEIITLSDSDDEENPWLRRLSESQRVKEEKPESDTPELEAPESPEMEFVDELLELKKDFDDVQQPEDIEVPIDKTRELKSDSRSIIKSPRSMTSSEIDKDINDYQDSESDSNIFHTSGSPSRSKERKSKSDSRSIIKPPQSMTLSEIDKDINDYQDSESSSNIFHTSGSPSHSKERKKSPEKSVEESLQNKQGTPKGPKIIAPLYLPPRKRLSLKDYLHSNDADALDSPSTSKGRIGVRECSIKLPRLPVTLTARTKRELQLADRIKQKKYEDEQRIRRIKNKWARSVPLPLGKRKSPEISKNQKLKIVNERKEKLKALATKQKLNSVAPSVERVAAKPKAKISTKTRGDFLINEQSGPTTKTAPEIHAEAPTSKNEGKSSKSISKDSETQSTSKDRKTQSKSVTPKKTKSSEIPKELNKGKKESQTKSSSTKDKKRSEKRSKSVERSSDNLATSLENKSIESLKELSLNQKENRVPNLSDKKEEGEKTNNKKKVRFSDNLCTVREYEIDPNNTMKKCTGKDALIPKDKIAGARKVDKTQHPKLEEFLVHIFKWNPSWLEEQKHLQTEPPIVDNELLMPLLTNYKSYKDYYQIIMPLLLVELWHGLTKEFESIDKNNRRQTVFCSIVNNSVTSQPIPSANTSLTTMLLEVLASEEDIRKQTHPVYGDLVFLELCYRNNEGKQNFLKVFAYVTHLHKTPITQHTIFNRDLMNYTTNPSGVLTYTILTRSLKLQLCINRVLRLRCVTYLRASMRMVQALQSLPSSPLLNLIINPKVEQYQLSVPAKQSFLVTKDKLNHKQMEAVFKTTETIVRKEPKICLVQGPPGTGKSEVIVNMVMQILYGDNRYRNRETTLRILLCAPSNAAIDEIVLRLLDRRAKLTNDRFKMVRVGLLGPMHPRVREISVEELAKREVKRTINSYQTCGQSMNTVEEEMRFLEARLNAFQSKLNSTQPMDENQIQYTKMKISEVRTRYDLIKTWTQSNGNNINPRDLSKLQRGSENNILLGADIIACTLSSCYTNIMEFAFGGTQKNISVCIVDEATQSCEAETLIPLMLGVNTLVLVGDPAQLPATVISQRAKKLGLDQSLFSRTQRAFDGQNNSPVIMLNVQYRMDVHISYWPNKYFYGGRLKNGIIREQPVLPFYPYRVMNLDSYQNSDKFSNTREAEFVANLIYSMINHLDVKKVTQVVTIGVITPYRNQQSLVQAKINQRLLSIAENLKAKVHTEVNTVDSFQGHERDIIIMSCVRTNGIGFLSDPQRLCVALTRAKHCLVLCGNFGTFQRDTMWRALLSDAQSRKNYIELKSDSTQNEILSVLVR